MKPLFLSLGSNIAPRLYFLLNALQKIEQQIGIIKKYSKLYETDAWGNESLNLFYNLAIEVNCNLPILQIIKITQSIEKQLDRNHKLHWQNRTIDIDIIFYDDLILETEKLTIPHKLMHERNFVLQPMADLNENFIHPILQKPIKELILQCKDDKKIKPKTF